MATYQQMVPGSLSPHQWTYEGTRYQVTGLAISSGALHLVIKPSGKAKLASNTRFTLRIGTRDFSFGDTTVSASFGSDQFVFGQTPPSWSGSVGDVVAVKLLRVAPRPRTRR